MLRTKKLSLAVCGAMLALLLSGLDSSLMAQQRDVMMVGKKGTVVFRSPTRVGSYTLPPAEYKIYCEHTDSGHQLVFIRLQQRLRYYNTPNETSDITKVPCWMEQLDATAQQTELHTATDDSGQWYVTRVLIRGENVGHIFWRSEPLRPVELPNVF
jgi:hypothetical protein